MPARSQSGLNNPTRRHAAILFAVEHKSLFHNVLAIFKVDETATLKMTNLLYDSYLRTTPKLNVGSALGQAIAGLINIFNPELVVIGGRLAIAKDYLMLPIKSAINRHSLIIVSKDTSIKFSKLGKKSGPIGACMLSRSRLLGLL